ncbi:MAG: hypothetical protein IPL70_12425, partial [Uliginosibacterium sp.]|nr:hypothetical protein [Uliginosibacterium sp.]
MKAPGHSKAQGQDCHFDSGLYEAFYAPRVAAKRVKPGKPAILMKKPYRVITAMGGEIASVELIGEGESITQANKILHKKLMADIRFYLACTIFSAGGRLFSNQDSF